jgi:hypothetical protein
MPMIEIGDLEKFNGWWTTGRVRGELLKPTKRRAFQELLKQCRGRQVTLLTGLRRVGKTTLLYQLIEELLKETEGKHILYFSFDEKRYCVKEVLETYEKKILKKNFEDCGKIFVFLDEVQKAKDWSSGVKVFYDLHPNLKFFLSGSASLTLSKGALENLAGRFSELQLSPLTFKEFLEIKGVRVKGEDLELYQRKALPLFMDYLRKAGFPEIVGWENDEEIKEYVKNAVVARVLLRDVPAEFGLRDVELMESVLKLIFSGPGLIFNVNSISRSLGRSRITISNYLSYLKYGLVVRTLSNFRRGVLAASRKLKKVYPSTTSLTFAYSDQFYQREFFGRVLETYAVNAINADFYFRIGSREVDAVLRRGEKLIPVEVKEVAEEEDVRKFVRMLDLLGAREGIIVTLEQFGEKVLGNKRIKILPCWSLDFAI